MVRLLCYHKSPVQWQILVCRLLKFPLSAERVQEIITQAVEIEKEFIIDSLPVSLSTVYYGLLHQC